MSEALQVAVSAAKTAGKIQRERNGDIGRIRYKDDINPVTEIDLLCEKEIIKQIRKRFPDHDILAEESAETPTGTSENRWIIDPLDGTVNYAHGYPCYCVSIALEHKNKVTIGVVYNPSLDELFVAEKDDGATLNGKPIHVSSICNMKQSLLVTGFAYDVAETDNDNLNHFRNFTKACQAVRRPGSAALDLCYVAMGRFEGFWELKLHSWDMAAGALLVKEAGGMVSQFDGSSFTVYDREILATNGLIHNPMIAILTSGKK
tara:strand:- start:366 stop:1148 length:783 start_codon:yes stop_codon:yes gene_type:complete